MSGLEIARAEITAYELPFARPYVTSRGRLHGRRIALLKLWTGDGVIGWGEAVPLSLRGGDSLETVLEEIHRWVDWALGRVVSFAPDIQAGWGSELLASSPARAAVSMALVDSAARALDQPAWRFLGAERSGPVRCNATLIAGEPAAVASDAADWADAGFRTFKLKVGGRSDTRTGVKRDVETVKAVRAAVGSDARIRVDANGAWSLDQAHLFLSECGAELELIEQPVTSACAMRTLRERSYCPIAADEAVNSVKEARYARESGVCDLATVKLSKLGGFPASLEGTLPVYLSSAIDGPIGIAAAAHAYQALESEVARLPSRPGSNDPEPIAHGLATQRMFAHPIASEGCLLHGHELTVGPGTGWGVSLDHAVLDRFRI